jgi:tRNA-2-methylthio-N6-dimethylallyladenosine synthase
VPADVKRQRLNTLLALQELVGRERNEAWRGCVVEVLLDTLTPPRSHDHDGDLEGRVDAPNAVAMSGRTRGNKLVHVLADLALMGSEVTVRIDHAGPYALRGNVVSEEPAGTR